MSTEQWPERHYLINDSSIDQSKKPFQSEITVKIPVFSTGAAFFWLSHSDC